jgi:hypothetical protein
VNCALALISPLSGSRFLFVAIAQGRPDTQKALPGRLRVDQTVAKRFSFLAALELGDDLPCLTVNDDEWLQGAELSGDRGTAAARYAGQLSRSVGLDADQFIDASDPCGVRVAPMLRLRAPDRMDRLEVPSAEGDALTIKGT